MFDHLKARLAEGSSWAAIGGVLGTLGTQLSAPLNATCFMAAAVAAIAAVLLKDKGTPA